MTEFTLTTLKPSKTEAIRFKGRIIAETEWTTSRGEYMRFEIWETEGGAYITVIEGSVPGDREKLITVEVIEPIYRDELVLADRGRQVVHHINGNPSDNSPENLCFVDATETPGIQHINGTRRIRDEKAMHIAVLRAFDAHDRARSMIRSQLKWNCVREVA